MNDPVGNFIMPFILLLALFFAPTMIITMKADESSQKIIDNSVQEFVDNARSSGKITAAEYEKMMNMINTVQPLCNIEITYGKLSYLPDDIAGNTVEYFDVYNVDAILDTIYTDTGDNEDFFMADGDYLKVVVTNSSPTLGNRIFSLFSPSVLNMKTIATTYGGYVTENGLTTACAYTQIAA